MKSLIVASITVLVLTSKRIDAGSSSYSSESTDDSVPSSTASEPSSYYSFSDYSVSEPSASKDPCEELRAKLQNLQRQMSALQTAKQEKDNLFSKISAKFQEWQQISAELDALDAAMGRVKSQLDALNPFTSPLDYALLSLQLLGLAATVISRASDLTAVTQQLHTLTAEFTAKSNQFMVDKSAWEEQYNQLKAEDTKPCFSSELSNLKSQFDQLNSGDETPPNNNNDAANKIERAEKALNGMESYFNVLNDPKLADNQEIANVLKEYDDFKKIRAA